MLICKVSPPPLKLQLLLIICINASTHKINPTDGAPYSCWEVFNLGVSVNVRTYKTAPKFSLLMCILVCLATLKKMSVQKCKWMKKLRILSSTDFEIMVLRFMLQSRETDTLHTKQIFSKPLQVDQFHLKITCSFFTIKEDRTKSTT
jgi:hypothetical protein